MYLHPQGLRAQIDRDQYRRNMQEEIRGTRGLYIREDSVEDLVIEGNDDGAIPQVVGACLGIIHGSTLYMSRLAPPFQVQAVVSTLSAVLIAVYGSDHPL